MEGQCAARRVPALLTRPRAASEAFAAALTARFGDRAIPVIAPLMAPACLTPDLPQGRFDAVIFTSATGVAAAGRLAAHLPRRAFCVGAQTAARARALGFDACSADGDADALVSLVLAQPDLRRLLHLRGEETRGDIARRLTSAGTETHSAVLYRQVPQPLTDRARRLLDGDGPVILPLFSAQSARRAALALTPAPRARLHVAVLSPAVAAATGGLAPIALTVAERPDAQAMLDAIGALLGRLAAP